MKLLIVYNTLSHMVLKFSYDIQKILIFKFKININIYIYINFNMSDKLLWTKKYQPTVVTDLESNLEQVELIYLWLKNYDNNNNNNNKKNIKTGENPVEKKTKKKKEDYSKSCLLITGSHGVGKTVSIEVLLKRLRYDIYKLDINAVKTMTAKELINKAMTTSNILNMINETTD